jgi:hypothetical protein
VNVSLPAGSLALPEVPLGKASFAKSHLKFFALLKTAPLFKRHFGFRLYLPIPTLPIGKGKKQSLT